MNLLSQDDFIKCIYDRELKVMENLTKNYTKVDSNQHPEQESNESMENIRFR